MLSRRTTPAFGDSPQTGVTKRGHIPSVRSPVASPKSVPPQVACIRQRMPLLSSPPHLLQDNVMRMDSTNIGTNSSPVKQRLQKLQQYGEPPPLSPFLMMPVQPILCKEFHIPLRKVSPPSSTDSPPLSLDSNPS